MTLNATHYSRFICSRFKSEERVDDITWLTLILHGNTYLTNPRRG